jgi:Acyltransferase family
VAIFSLVTGYVCSLKPIRQARNGDFEGALNSVARSAFRRIPRLVLPTTLITIITWFLCQLGAFQIAKETNSAWMSYTAPTVTPFFGDALRSLIYQVIETWTWGRNIYDPNQWTLQPLLKGSMLVYITIFATVYMQPKYRMMISMAQWVYYYISNDCRFSLSCPDLS